MDLTRVTGFLEETLQEASKKNLCKNPSVKVLVNESLSKDGIYDYDLLDSDKVICSLRLTIDEKDREKGLVNPPLSVRLKVSTLILNSLLNYVAYKTISEEVNSSFSKGL